jgi:hypothetical protein
MLIETLIAILVIVIFFITVFHFSLQGLKKKKVEKDLIYLEFLIQHGMKDRITTKNIKSTLLDYLNKKDYESKKLDKCIRLFIEKYGINN